MPSQPSQPCYQPACGSFVYEYICLLLVLSSVSIVRIQSHIATFAQQDALRRSEMQASPPSAASASSQAPCCRIASTVTTSSTKVKDYVCLFCADEAAEYTRSPWMTAPNRESRKEWATRLGGRKAFRPWPPTRMRGAGRRLE